MSGMFVLKPITGEIFTPQTTGERFSSGHGTNYFRDAALLGIYTVKVQKS